jgi:hypothetical protein
MLLSINSQHALLRSGMSNSVAMHRKPVTIDENFTTVWDGFIFYVAMLHSLKNNYWRFFFSHEAKIQINDYFCFGDEIAFFFILPKFLVENHRSANLQKKAMLNGRFFIRMGRRFCCLVIAFRETYIIWILGYCSI